MKRREQLSGIWLMAMTLLSLCGFTVFIVAQLRLNILIPVYLTLPVLQIAALIIYMWGPEKLRFTSLKVLYRILYASSVFVIPSFVFVFMGLISQYHANVRESIPAETMAVEELLPQDHTVIYNTGTVYVFFPEYTEIELVCGKRPSKSDESITWCSGAAFQHTISLDFTHENVEGDHAVRGTLYKSPYNKDNYAAFVFAEGQFAFEFENPTEAIKEAANAGGSGFMQYGLIRDGEPAMNFDWSRTRCYRALAELNGNVCIIDSVNMLHLDEFMEELFRLHVTNAVYMDMGAGWNYSWYRGADRKVVTLFELPVPWSHNWVVFR